MKAKTIIAAVILLVIGFAVYLTYNKPHRNPENERGIAISASELLRQFQHNEDSANLLYLDKTVVVSGKIVNITRNQENFPVVTLEADGDGFGIQCTMQDSKINLQKNEHVTLKGVCKGFLSDVIITSTSVASVKK